MIKLQDFAAEVPFEYAAEMLEKMNTWYSLDLGSTLIVFGEHHVRGPLAVLTTVCGRAAVLFL